MVFAMSRIQLLSKGHFVDQDVFFDEEYQHDKVEQHQNIQQQHQNVVYQERDCCRHPDRHHLDAPRLVGLRRTPNCLCHLGLI